MDKLTDYVITVDNCISEETVKLLLDEYRDSDDWTPYVKGKAGGNTPSNAIAIAHPKIINNSEKRKLISQQANNSILSVFDQYHAKFSRRESGLNFLPVKQLVGMRLIRYHQGESMDNHVDKYPDPDTGAELWPSVTFTMNMNDDYIGGELDLLDGKLVCKAVARQCIMFPANFLYPHSVHMVEKGTRYSLVGWFI